MENYRECQSPYKLPKKRTQHDPHARVALLRAYISRDTFINVAMHKMIPVQPTSTDLVHSLKVRFVWVKTP